MASCKANILQLFFFFPLPFSLIQLAKEIREIYENDAVFSIIASSNKAKNSDSWIKDPDECCSSDYTYAKRATK